MKILSCPASGASRPDARACAAHEQGLRLARRKQWSRATRCFRQAIARQPTFAPAHFCLGRVHAVEGRWTEAVACFETALRLRPRFPAALNRLGLAYLQLEQWAESVACHRKLLRRRPRQFSAHRRLTDALLQLGSFAEARRHVELALVLKPYDACAHVHRATFLLRQGDFHRGGTEYEWRWRLPGQSAPYPHLRAWPGGSPRGKVLLLHAEQGLGDTLQFIRYAAVLQTAGATVVFVCPPALHRLLAGCKGIDRLLSPTDPLPACDAHAPLLSLPRLLGTTLRTIPAGTPYLHAEPGLVTHWRRRLARYSGCRVGIAWQGNPAFDHDRQRSLPLAAFAPLAGVGGVRLFSLQKPPGTDQLAGIAKRFKVVDLGQDTDEATGTFVDTAAIIRSLDLVITSDSAIAHLAGALGTPVWLALPVGCDWRWFTGRDDSPWYPRARLFRQHRPGDWTDVFQRLAVALDGVRRPRQGAPTIAQNPCTA